jgi:beta-glucosidase
MIKSIENLLTLMTLEEKISLLAGADFWHTYSIERLGIPALKVTDGPYGARTVDDLNPDITIPATCFPTGVAMAATWNPQLVGQIGCALGEEARDRGCSILLGPCVNIHRHPLAGRNFESFSEDPFLSSEMAVAYIEGVQSRRIGVSVKHFALNNSEFQRFTISSEAGERALREIYFPSFEKAVKTAQPWTVMCSYNQVNGTYASENRNLLTDILKKEWGFDGLVISDWFATHSAAAAALAGLDLEMPGPARFFGRELLSAVETGEVGSAMVDDKVRRILTVILKSGAFKKKPAFSKKAYDFARHYQIAGRAAAESIVLLKNENHLLPLNKNRFQKVAVIGPNAAEARVEGGGSSMVKPFYKVSPLAGLKSQARSWEIGYEPGCRSNRLTPILNPKYLFQDPQRRHHGLLARYFNSPDLSGKPVIKRGEKEFSRRWFRETHPETALKTDLFSVRWKGWWFAPLSGTYRFGVITDGCVNISINEKSVDFQSGNQPAGDFDLSEETLGLFTFEAGTLYSITIEYSKNPHRPSLVRSLRIGCELPEPEDLLQRAVNLAAQSDVALVFAGLNDEWESEGFDRLDMKLPEPQGELIRGIATANPRTIVVLNNGSPVDMADWIDRVPAVLEAWYPGQECGHAIAAVITGNINPSGKLPDTFPKRLEDTPAFPYYPGSGGKVVYGEDIWVGYRHFDKNNIEPLFPFGHGLSYTSFKYGKLRVNQIEPGLEGRLTVCLSIKNSGDVAGSEVVQLYIRDVDSSLPRPPQELKGFKKINLGPGKRKTLVFDLDRAAFSFFHPGLKQWVTEPGEFEILVGSSSRDIRARLFYTLKIK